MKVKTHKQTKTLLALALGLCLAAAAIVPAAVSARAKSLANQDPTEYLEQTLATMGYTPDGTYTIDNTYAQDLTPNGLEYIFTVDGEQAYALMIREIDAVGNVYYDIMELFFNTPSPFATASGKKVYIKMLTYIDATDDGFVDLLSGATLTDEQVQQIAEDGFTYKGSDQKTEIYEKVDYSKRIVDNYEFPYGLPAYTSSIHSNACANIAGAIILGYYDVYLPDLVPGEVLFTMPNGKIYYEYSTDSIKDIINNQLYYDMKTNVNNGTSYSDFKTGLTAYVNRQGHKTSYTSVMVSGSFSYYQYKVQVRQPHPIALFFAGFNTSYGALNDTQNYEDIIDITYHTANHVMVGSGYEDISYYNASGTVFRTDNWLKVSTAFTTGNGYVHIDDKIHIDNAVAVSIY